jgi:hypothetical protein
MVAMFGALLRLAPSLLMLALALRVRQTIGRFLAAGATSPQQAVRLGDIGLRREPAVRSWSVAAC